MATHPVYSDKLVEITNNSILFRNYYFPLGSKRVAFSDVDTVEAKEASTRNGKWRIHGTLDFRTWFPRDWKRPGRDRIFFMSFPHSRRRIAFTVEDSGAVAKILTEQGLL
jgi:hypothetical protein